MTHHKNNPLCVDCDGTLIHTDLLHEAILLMIKQYPIGLLKLPFWLLKGKAYLKEQIAKNVKFDWSTLPYREQVMEMLYLARDNDRLTVLATASPSSWAKGIAAHLGLFDEVIATENGNNFSGKVKADTLAKQFGEKNFDYIGDSYVDIPVWEKCKEAIIVGTHHHLIDRVKQLKDVKNVRFIQSPKANVLAYIKALRVAQWLKNLLIFVPLLAAHKINDTTLLTQSMLAFMAFSTCASAVYILNDLLDLESDRIHIRKRKRPFASCLIPISHGVLMIPFLLVAAISITTLLPPLFTLVLAVYFIITFTYSARLKRQVIVDVILLAGLYTMRIIACLAATGIVPSFWLLAFSMFIFLSLALIKRYSELLVTLAQNKEQAAGRGYSVLDLPVLMSIGTSASMSAVMVLALYINLPETQQMYAHKLWLWLILPLLLYWLCRIWIKAHRGQVDDDPIIFAIKDWQSLVIFFLSACIFWAAS